MSSSYDVKPVNKNCSGKVGVSNTSTKGSGDSKVSSNLDNSSYQNESNNRYDTIDSESVKPLYGGKKNKYILEYENKKEILYETSEKDLLKNYFKNKKFHKDILVILTHRNNKNKFIIRNNKANNFIKINY